MERYEMCLRVARRSKTKAFFEKALFFPIRFFVTSKAANPDFDTSSKRKRFFLIRTCRQFSRK